MITLLPEALLTAIAKYKAIRHNRPAGQTDEQQDATDDRVFTAEIELEAQLLAAGLMSPDDGILSAELGSEFLTVVFEFGTTWNYPV